MPGVRRLVVSGLGWVTTLTGVALFPLPGPGLLLIAVGLWLLATQHEWAARRVESVRRRALEGAARSVATGRRALWSALVATLLAASGLLWVWAPPAPGWWTAVLPAGWWLAGGLWSGVGQVVSGLITLGLVGYAYLRLRPGRAGDSQDRAREVGLV